MAAAFTDCAINIHIDNGAHSADTVGL